MIDILLLQHLYQAGFGKVASLDGFLELRKEVASNKSFRLLSSFG